MSDKKQTLENRAIADIASIAHSLAMDAHFVNACVQPGNREHNVVHGVKIRTESIQRSLDALRRHITLLEVLKELQ